mgnify:CR=1 FL=1
MGTRPLDPANARAWTDAETRFAATAARYFNSMEIIEAHHATKVDSPSGTAVRTAELMLASRGELGPVAAPHVDQRARGLPLLLFLPVSFVARLARFALTIALTLGSLAPLGADVMAQQVLEEIDIGVRESYGDVRELLMHFRTRTNTEDIIPALETTLRKFEHQTGVHTQLDVQDLGALQTGMSKDAFKAMLLAHAL